MTLSGPLSTDEFLQLTGGPIPEGGVPMLLARWGGEVIALFRLPEGWAMDRWWNGVFADPEDRRSESDPARIADGLLRTALDHRMSSAGLGFSRIEVPMPDSLVTEVERLGRVVMAESGARPLYAATYTTGEWEDTYTATVALYPTPDLAIAHVRAADIHEQCQDASDEYDDPGHWGVEIKISREGLPSHLQAVLDEGVVPPRRPSMHRDEEHVWHVDVPDRGLVSFDGSGNEGAAARFLCSLPLAKPSSRFRVEAEDFRAPERLEIVEGDLLWRHPAPEWDLSYVLEGKAVASGPDAAALLEGARAAMAKPGRRDATIAVDREETE